VTRELGRGAKNTWFPLQGTEELSNESIELVLPQGKEVFLANKEERSK